jgi:hypothetical protein
MAKDKIEIEVIAKGLEKVQKDLQKLTKTGEQSKKGFNTMKIAAAGFAAFMTGKVVQAFGAVTRAAAKLNQGMESMERRFGISSDKVLKKLREVAKGTIADTDLIAAANRAMTLGVTKDLDKLAEALEVARGSAKTMGIDATQAFNDLITGIGRKSPLILDNLGLIVKGFEAQSKASGGTGSATELLNKVLEENLNISRKVNVSQLSMAERFEIMDTRAKNLKITIGQALLPFVERLFNGLDAIANLDVFKKLKREVGGVEGLFIKIDSQIQQTTENMRFFFNALVLDMKKGFLQFAQIGPIGAKALQKANAKIVKNQQIHNMTMLAIQQEEADKLAALEKGKLDRIGEINAQGGTDAAKSFGEEYGKELKSQAKQALAQAAQEMANFLTEATIRGLDSEIAALQAKHETELAMLEEHKEKINEINTQETESKLMMLEEQKNAAILAGNEQAANEKQNSITRIEVEEETKKKEAEINKNFEAKMNALKNKRIDAEHKAAIAQSIINGAVGGTLAFAQLGFPAGLIAAGIIHTLTAVQTGIIAANKPPKFAQGTNFSPGGPAIVGETGPELITLPQGSQVTPSNDTINNTTENRNITVNVQANNSEELLNDLRQRYGFDVFAEA